MKAIIVVVIGFITTVPFSLLPIKSEHQLTFVGQKL